VLANDISDFFHEFVYFLLFVSGDDPTNLAGSDTENVAAPPKKRLKLSRVGDNQRYETTHYHVELSDEEVKEAENELLLAGDAGNLRTKAVYEKTRALQRLDFEKLGLMKLLAKYPFLDEVCIYIFLDYLYRIHFKCNKSIIKDF
jgi:hypothetical protein